MPRREPAHRLETARGLVGDHRGQSLVLDGREPVLILRGRPGSSPTSGGPLAGAPGPAGAGPGRNTALPAHAPFGDAPASDAPATGPPAPRKAVGSPPSAGRVRTPGCRCILLLGRHGP